MSDNFLFLGIICPIFLFGRCNMSMSMEIKIYERHNCVLCDNKKLLDIRSIIMPLYIINNPHGECWNMSYGYCENCYSVQLKTLLDQDILYDKNYIQPVSTAYTWVQHNISFVNFVIKSININKPLIEIGSSSFVLGKHLVEYYKDYTVFDYSIDQAVQQNGVTYIEGNCENYNFPKDSNIIMSHVFEHLYDPKKFIENCRKNCVQNIIISIPNMNNLSEFNVSNQHTFLYNNDDIEYIFNINGYNLVEQLFFNTNDHSFPCLFFHFNLYSGLGCLNSPTVRDIHHSGLMPRIEVKLASDTTENINNLFCRKIIENRHLYHNNFLKMFEVPEKTFIATAGFISLCIYNIIKNKNHLIGAIDYNKKLQNKIFGHTNLIIQPYEYLKGFSSEYSILVFGYRTPDIIKNIREVNNEIKIIELSNNSGLPSP